MERLAATSIALVGALALAAHGQSSPSSGATSTSESVLPRSFVVSLSVVEEFFPEVTKVAPLNSSMALPAKSLMVICGAS